MDVESFRLYCLAKTGVTEGFPFGEGVLVFKVLGKMFALTNLDADAFEVNLKCEPDQAIEWRARHPEVQPGYHMSKKHWNTVDFDGDLPETLLREMVDRSYALVVQGLRKADRQRLAEMNDRKGSR